MTKKEFINKHLIEKLNTTGEVIYRQFYGFEAETYVAFVEKGSRDVKAIVATCVKDGDSLKLTVNDEADATVFNANQKLLSYLTPTIDKKANAWRDACRQLIVSRRAGGRKSPAKRQRSSVEKAAPQRRATKSAVVNQAARAQALFERAWSDVASVLTDFAVNESSVSRELTFMNAQRKFGSCRRTKSMLMRESFVIRLAKICQKLSDQQILDVLAHELIHTMPGCFNHGPAFKHAARVLSATLPEYSITVYVPKDVAAEVHAGDDNFGMLVCECGCQIQVSKRTKAWRNPESRVCKRHRSVLHHAA